MNTDELIENVECWATAKKIDFQENAPYQLAKFLEESGDMAGAFLKKDRVKLVDGIGDTMVTLIIFAQQNGLTLNECLEAAWEEIKDRTGKTQGGVFIKD